MTTVRVQAATGGTSAREDQLAGNKGLAETRKGSDPPGHGSPSPGGHRDSGLKIAIVDESPVRSAILEDGLREAGFVQVERVSERRISSQSGQPALG